MCGIVGVFSRTGRPLDPAPVARMRDEMAHRGPDDAGLWHGGPRGNVVFGHRRLAIVDLSPDGHQPMANEDGSVVVVYNGEIYNHEPLRRELERRGHRFRSRCDTEVLVHLYEEHGPALVERLVGMFAFAIWDANTESILVARDRLGIKPLYWLHDGDTFAFASEIKALLPLARTRDIDPTALTHYLTFVSVPPPRTLFAGISKLAPASTLVAHVQGVDEPVRYWDPIGNRADFDGEPIEWEAELRLRLEESVDRRMMSDVPVGILLSGGVDSSTNVALMSGLVEHPVNTFSIGFEGAESYNELQWARRVARDFRTAHHEVMIGPDDLWDFIPKLVHHQDEPIADPVCVPLHFVSKLAKESGVTVVHVGEGADELLAGYPTYVLAHRMLTGPWRRLRALSPALRGLVAGVGGPALGLAPRLEIHSEALRRSAQDEGHLWWGGAVAFYEGGLERITTRALRRAADLSPREVVAGIAADADRAGARDELDRLIYQDLRLRLPELLLMRVDKLTMANSIEARVPFLDHELVELAMAMPREQKIAHGSGKVVLKRAMRGRLPDDLLWRPKQGFAAPVAEWFRGELGARLERRLRETALTETGWIEPGRVRSLLAQHRSGRADRSVQLWSLLNLSAWFDAWIAGEVTEP